MLLQSLNKTPVLLFNRSHIRFCHIVIGARRFALNCLDKAVLRVEGFAMMRRNCVASSAALKSKRGVFSAMSKAGKCAVSCLDTSVSYHPNYV